MIERVLVPIDGSDAAEDILPVVATPATTGSTIRLIHVAPVPENVVTPEGRTVAEVKRALLGSVAEVMLHRARIGVLLYRPPRDA
jgi:nucleotide-binding universal stress UspA family protein